MPLALATANELGVQAFSLLISQASGGTLASGGRYSAGFEVSIALNGGLTSAARQSRRAAVQAFFPRLREFV
jgi:hypothetical protein